MVTAGAGSLYASGAVGRPDDAFSSSRGNRSSARGACLTVP